MSYRDTITITLGDCAENHAGMQVLGKRAAAGFTPAELRELHSVKGAKIYSLARWLPEVDRKKHDAVLAVLPDGVDALLGEGTADRLYTEMKEAKVDTKAVMRGKIVNKQARRNNCYADEAQEADIDSGRGTVHSFDSSPRLKALRAKLPELLGPKAANLIAETNHYYDPDKCGIGFHGDTEREIVIGVRLGKTMPLDYQWFREGSPIGERFHVQLSHGTLYVMSAKATGNDWKKRKIETLRHAAGAPKYLTTK